MRKKLNQYLRRTSGLENALLLIIPWLIIYNLGTILTDFRTMNGVDLFTPAVIRLSGLKGFLICNGLILLVGGFTYFRTIKNKNKTPLTFTDPLYLLAEAALYSAILGTLVAMAMSEVPYVSITVPEKGLYVFISAGAGVYEELIFRMLMIAGLLAWLESGGRKAPFIHTSIALIISSVVFSLAHYLGPESFQLYTFLYRTFAGLLLGGIFLVRGLAVAVYTHVMYNLWAFLLN
ncbi:MAG: hypothetical protein CMH54_03960 [Myxococcales bacterium]|nr:hypothetical protein [Myxococcales bacterium]